MATLPMTATPRVPPASRVASLTAEPTPALAGGRTLRIDSVAGRRGQAEPEAHEHHLRRDLGRTGSSVGEGAIQANAAPKSTRPGDDDDAGADPAGQRGADDRADGDAGGDRQDPHAGRERAVAADELEVLRDQEDEAEQGEEGDRHRAARGARTPASGTASRRASGALPAPLDDDERQRRATAATAKPADGASGRPAVARGLDDRVDEQRRWPPRTSPGRARRGAAAPGRATRARPRRPAPRPATPPAPAPGTRCPTRSGPAAARR